MADTSEWVVASAATEHTGKPQLAQYECTYNASSATEHADAASEFERVELQNADWWSVATEHADDANELTAGTNDPDPETDRPNRWTPEQMKKMERNKEILKNRYAHQGDKGCYWSEPIRGEEGYTYKQLLNSKGEPAYMDTWGIHSCGPPFRRNRTVSPAISRNRTSGNTQT